ncbi:MAG: GspH/FimT family pseudopilin [Granulosicoccus sp.]
MFSSSLRQRGFTLLEVITTLAIVAIVAVFAIPSMRSILGESELTATSNQLAYSLQSARSEAIKRITPVSLCPSPAPDIATPTCGGTYSQGWIVFVDANANGVVNATTDVIILRSEALSPAFTISPNDRFSSGVTFDISGVSTNAAGVPIGGDIVISHDGKKDSRRIRIAASGRINSSSFDVPANTPTDDDTASSDDDS